MDQDALGEMMGNRLPPIIAYDETTDVVIIDGYKFARELFWNFTDSPPGKWFRIVSRKDGVVTLEEKRESS